MNRHGPSSTHRVRRLLAAAAALGLVVGAGPAGAQGTGDGPPAWAYDLAHDVMSPYCPGRTLAECPSPQAEELRLWILTQAAAGASREEVEATLLDRFGDRILSAPRAEGFGLAAYLLPAAGFAAGGVVLWLALRRLTAGRRESPEADATVLPRDGPQAPRPAARPADGDLERQVDEELARG